MGLANLLPGEKLVKIEQHGFGVVCAIVDYEGESIYRICQAVNCHRELLAALRDARDMLETADRYFPRSIKNGDRFRLLNTLANSVNPAIAKAEDSLAVRGAVQEQLPCE